MRKKSNIDLLKTVSRNIRNLRHKLDVSQLKLAEKIDCHLNHIARIERGQVDPSLSMLYRISKALCVSLPELLIKESTSSKQSSEIVKKKKTKIVYGFVKDKLNEIKVRRIKRLIIGNRYTVSEIAKEFGVSRSLIDCIKHNKLWKEIPWG